MHRRYTWQATLSVWIGLVRQLQGGAREAAAIPWCWDGTKSRHPLDERRPSPSLIRGQGWRWGGLPRAVLSAFRRLGYRPESCLLSQFRSGPLQARCPVIACRW